MSDVSKPGPEIVVVGTGRGNVEMLGGAGVAAIRDPVTASPIVEGPHGRAWLCDIANGMKKLNVKPDEQAALAQWVIEAQWAHPAWHSYTLVLIHLRPLPDGRETMLYLPDATHELWLYAMNPDGDRNKLLADGIVGGHWLTPCNFSAQFIEISDDLALDRIRKAVQAICDGNLSPDTDFTPQWTALFGDNMLKDRANRRPPVVREEGR